MGLFGSFHLGFFIWGFSGVSLDAWIDLSTELRAATDPQSTKATFLCPGAAQFQHRGKELKGGGRGRGLGVSVPRIRKAQFIPHPDTASTLTQTNGTQNWVGSAAQGAKEKLPEPSACFTKVTNTITVSFVMNKHCCYLKPFFMYLLLIHAIFIDLRQFKKITPVRIFPEPFSQCRGCGESLIMELI